MTEKLLKLFDRMFRQRDLITRKFYLVIGVFTVIVISLVALAHFQSHVLDAVRTYVGGEGFWSKGQKDAVLHLEHYAKNHDPGEYALFQKGLQPSLGDRKARLALQSDPPDLEQARDGFLDGRNHPDDIDGLINLFLYFHEVSYMKSAIAIWTEGDALIDRLLILGREIHSEIATGSPDSQHIQELLKEVDQVNASVGKLEDRFSATLGDAARWISNLTSNLMFAATILLLAIGTILSRQIVRGIRRTQAELIASEARFRHVVESDMIGIAFWHADGLISDANDLFLQTIGYSREDLENGGVNWQAITPSEFRDRDGHALQEVSSHGSCSPYEKEFLHKDGHRVAVLIGAASFNGSEQHGVSFVIDISERRKAEQAQRLAATVFHSASEAIFVTDSEPAIRAVNPAFCRITGYSEEDVLGRNPSILGSGKHDPAFYKGMWRKLLDEGSWSGDIINRRKNGDVYQAWLSITAVRGEESSPREFVGVFSDVTDMRRMEEQLRQSQKMEAIGTLVGGIAHDFNNTLAAIKGNAYLAMQQTKDEEITEKLKTIDILSDHSADMVQQLLTFARKDIVQLAPLSLNELLLNHKKLTASVLPESIGVDIRLCDNELWINGDATQLLQILLNLQNNACDAVEGVESPRISITLDWLKSDAEFKSKHPEISSDLVARLQFSDNGTGMGREQLLRIFEPFYTTKEVNKGTGLGMSMVYGSIRTHSGAVEIDSEPGCGTTITIFLPIEEMVGPPEQVQPESSDHIEPPRKSGLTILLVDDNEGIRKICRESLQGLGYNVITTCEGSEALDVFREQSSSIDLVLTDIVMPNMGGFKLAEHIRMIRPSLPIIFMTGYDIKQMYVPELLKANSEILIKPFAINDIQRRIANLLKES